MAKHWITVGVGAVIATLVACGSDVSSPIEGGPSTQLGKNGGTDSSSGGTGGTGGTGSTSNGPVASVTMVVKVLTMSVGYYGSAPAIARDAAGVPVAKKITYTSSNPNIVAVLDTGVLFGKALGTAKIYASLDGFKDSATVTVVAAPPGGGGGGGGGQTAPVSEFNMTVVAFGRIPAADTSKAERVPGSTITIARIGGVSGDTLASPIPAGSGVADANGEVKFAKLAGGSYSIKVVPPSGSAYLETTSAIGPPRQADITVFVTMRHQ